LHAHCPSHFPSLTKPVSVAKANVDTTLSILTMTTPFIDALVKQRDIVTLHNPDRTMTANARVLVTRAKKKREEHSATLAKLRDLQDK
jgi:hypothetical protein